MYYHIFFQTYMIILMFHRNAAMARMKANQINIANRTPASVPVTTFSEVQGNMVCNILKLFTVYFKLYTVYF